MPRTIHEAYKNEKKWRADIEQGAGIIANREQEESRKSIEDEKLKVKTEKKVSKAALKSDWSCPGGTKKA